MSKCISNVVDVVHNAGISKKVAKLRPMGVVKGEATSVSILG